MQLLLLGGFGGEGILVGIIIPGRGECGIYKQEEMDEEKVAREAEMHWALWWLYSSEC